MTPADQQGEERAPRQYARRLEHRRDGDERHAHVRLGGGVNPNASTSAVTERKARMPCANRLGGPGTGSTRAGAAASARASDELTEWTERRTGEHAGEKP